MDIKGVIKAVLTKLRFLDSDEELDLEALMVWVFLFICAFRSFFTNLTLNISPSIKWTIQDINLAATLPILYSILSNSHRRYLNSKGAPNGQPTPPSAPGASPAAPTAPGAGDDSGS